MKKIQPNEKDFREWIIKTYDGWINRIEPSQGMNPGIPDLLVMTDIGLVPVELKIASLDDGLLWSSEIRPSQISWHVDYYQRNRHRQPHTAFLFGVWAKDTWKVFALTGEACRGWQNGFKIDALTELKNLTEDFEDWCARHV